MQLKSDDIFKNGTTNHKKAVIVTSRPEKNLVYII